MLYVPFTFCLFVIFVKYILFKINIQRGGGYTLLERNNLIYEYFLNFI